MRRVYARAGVSKERKKEKKSVLLLLEHHSRERLQRERKRRCARVPAVCVIAACAECININDVFCRKDAVKALFETAFLKRRGREESCLFFPPQTTHEFSSRISQRSRKEKEMKENFRRGVRKN